MDPLVLEKFKVHPDTIETLKHIASLNYKPFGSCSIEESREQSTRFTVDLPYDGTITEMRVDSPNVPEGIPIVIYKPANLPENPPLILFFHGGGFVIGNKIIFGPCLQMQSLEIPAIIVYVEYRLLPCTTDQFAPFNDCLAVTQWLLTNKETVGGNQTSKLGLFGDSSGCLVLFHVLREIKSRFEFMVLSFPVVTLNFDTPYGKQLSEALPVYNTDMSKKMFQASGLMSEEFSSDPRLNAYLSTDWKTLPPTLVITASLDPLRDVCIDFHKKLTAEGVQSEHCDFEGVPHGFFVRPLFYKTRFNECLKQFGDFISKFV